MTIVFLDWNIFCLFGSQLIIQYLHLGYVTCSYMLSSVITLSNTR